MRVMFVWFYFVLILRQCIYAGRFSGSHLPRADRGTARGAEVLRSPGATGDDIPWGALQTSHRRFCDNIMSNDQAIKGFTLIKQYLIVFVLSFSGGCDNRTTGLTFHVQCACSVIQIRRCSLRILTFAMFLI